MVADEGALSASSSDCVPVDGHVDAADTITLSHTELDVALIAPGGVPGVPHDIVALVTLVAPPDCLNGVVDMHRAVVGFSNDSACVVLKNIVVGRDGGTDRATLKNSLDA